jgi:hypothetical protein
MEAIPVKSGDARWDLFVALSDFSRQTLRLDDAIKAGNAYRAWCLGEDVPFEPLSHYQLMLWQRVIEWAGKLSRGVPGASSELCVARGRFVHSFYVKKGTRDGGEAKAEGREGGSGGQGRQAKAEAETY